MKQETALIIGAGPAGLTAAYELLKRTRIKPIVFEMSDDFGGISKTFNYKGNRIDFGGHRFFSKSDRVTDWWLNILPLENEYGGSNKSEKALPMPGAEDNDQVMLVRNRLSRIFFMRKLFDYPISINFRTIRNLGLIRITKIALSYLRVVLLPLDHENSLEEFLINRFGRELYKTFFRDYTEKVWGVPCREIKPEWGAQRIKGLSISKAVMHALRGIVRRNSSIKQEGVETTLIETFMYPKYGPGQMWQEAARLVREMGGDVYTNCRVVALKIEKSRVGELTVLNEKSGKRKTFSGDYVFSSMSVKDLIASMDGQVPQKVREVAGNLPYRDFITVGLLVRRLQIRDKDVKKRPNGLVRDNWIYIQEPDVKVGRLQIFNNWSPYLVQDKDKIWIGMEYFCNEGDELWEKPDSEFLSFAIDEIEKLCIVRKPDVLDGVVLRMKKTYPAYFGAYDEFDTVRKFTDSFTNLFLIGRNGMHRYNNQDHSMLTAMVAVDNILAGITTKGNIWEVNTEEEYHEEA
jgi:protoporphyrinogen oxidase